MFDFCLAHRADVGVFGSLDNVIIHLAVTEEFGDDEVELVIV